MSDFQFSDKNDFGQSAFDYVAQIVHDFGEQIIMEGNMSLNTEQCLFQLELVSSRWGFNPTRITALKELINEANTELKEILNDLGDHDD